MTYRPNPDPSPPTMLSFVCLACGMLCYLSGAAVAKYAGVFQMLGLAGLIASLYLLLRWRMTWFVFALRPRGENTPVWENTEAAPATGSLGNPYRYLPIDQLDLIVVKGQGNRTGAMECVLGLGDLLTAQVVSRKTSEDTPTYDRSAYQRQYPGAKVYEYIQTWHWERAIVAVFREGSGYAVLLLDVPPEHEIGQTLLGNKK